MTSGIQDYFCESAKQWPLPLEMMAVNMYAKAGNDIDIRKVKIKDRSPLSLFEIERRHLSSLFHKISWALIEEGSQGDVKVCIFSDPLLHFGMRYLLIAEKVVDKALLLFYKGKEFADDLKEVPIPLLDACVEWTYEDYGDAISFIMCDGCDLLTMFSRSEPIEATCCADVREILTFDSDELFKLIFLKYLLSCMSRFRNNVASSRDVQSRLDAVFIRTSNVNQEEDLDLYLKHVHILIKAV